MPQLNCTLSPGLWQLLQEHSQGSRQPAPLIVSKALAEYFDVAHHTLYQVSYGHGPRRGDIPGRAASGDSAWSPSPVTVASCFQQSVRLKCDLVHLVWIDGTYDMVRFQEVAKYGRASGVDLGPVDVIRFAEAFGAKGLKIETPDQISSTIKKALEVPGPVIIGIPVDCRDNHRLMEILHPDALN
jgi:hypothetical protein